MRPRLSCPCAGVLRHDQRISHWQRSRSSGRRLGQTPGSSRAQARVVAAAAEVVAEKRGLQVAAPRWGASCASPMRYIAPREDSRASVASKYVRARSATPLVRRTLQNPDARISLTFAATVVATANIILIRSCGTSTARCDRSRGHASAVSTRPDPSPETQTFSSTEASTGSGDAARPRQGG